MKLTALILALLFAAPLCAVNAGDAAPDFAFEQTWNMGSEQSLGSLRGNVVLLEYWATW
jgi:hypothetical protein